MGFLDDAWDVVFTPNLVGATDISLENDIFGSFTGADKDRAAQAQAAAAEAANQTQRYMYDQTREDTQPWRQTGIKALGELDKGSNDFNRDFTMGDFQADPGYQFRMAEGQKAIERSASARGGLNSGATMKALTKYGQDVGSQEYQSAYNRFNSDRDRRFNRLASLSGIGQTANTQINSAGQNMANNVSENQIGIGNANAAAITGKGDMWRGYGQTAMSAVAMCDERMKTNISEVSKADMAEFRKSIKAYSFEYLNQDHGDGKWIGPMAQDLEKSKLGRTLIVKDENGNKQIDLKKAMCLFLASMAEG